MARKVGHALHDILEAIERIEEITDGKSLVDFEASWQLRWLVQRAIVEAIGTFGCCRHAEELSRGQPL